MIYMDAKHILHQPTDLFTLHSDYLSLLKNKFLEVA